jgi:hypothetical protein
MRTAGPIRLRGCQSTHWRLIARHPLQPWDAKSLTFPAARQPPIGQPPSQFGRTPRVAPSGRHCSCRQTRRVAFFRCRFPSPTACVASAPGLFHSRTDSVHCGLHGRFRQTGPGSCGAPRHFWPRSEGGPSRWAFRWPNRHRARKRTVVPCPDGLRELRT